VTQGRDYGRSKGLGLRADQQRGEADMHPRLTYANVGATLALFIAMGGASVAALKLPKNSVGPKQLKKNSVTGPKIKAQTIAAAKIKDGTLTGTQINVSSLGTVPAAQTANSLVAAEAWHEVGEPGEPGFQNGWENAQTKAPPNPVPAGFYIDREGVVHLRGIVAGGPEDTVVFQLPAGYRPTGGSLVAPSNAVVRIYGSNSQVPGLDGAVVIGDGKLASLDGITFRAES
jgi:hypothetical protein